MKMGTFKMSKYLHAIETEAPWGFVGLLKDNLPVTVIGSDSAEMLFFTKVKKWSVPAARS